MRRRVLFVVLVGLLAAVAARIAAPSQATHSRARVVCGIERWTVKTLQDRPSLLRAQDTTVAHLTALPKPTSLHGTRLAFERHVFTVTTSASFLREEDDQDLHVILGSGRVRMIAEAPNAPLCSPRATMTRVRQMKTARDGVLAHRTCARARVTGVAFFDFLHGQTGVAPNGIELHPILGYTCLRGGGAPPPPPPGGKCAASYPDECIPPPPPDLDCRDIPYRNFRVLWNVRNPDPDHFDGNRNGIGCET